MTMKSPTRLLSGLLLLTVAVFSLTSCGDDDSAPVPRKTTYNFVAYDNGSGNDITGKALFTEIINTDSVEVTVTLKGKNINDLVTLPVKILEGTSLEGGDVLFDLGKYSGSKQQLTKAIKLSYDALTDLNGSMAVYSDEGDILSQAELGINTEFESNTMTNPLDGDKKNGQIRVYKRKTGSYVVIQVDLSGVATACKGVDHPARVYKADGTQDTDFQLNAVADSSGISATALTDKDYNDLKNYDGFVKILCSEGALDVALSQGSF